MTIARLSQQEKLQLLNAAERVSTKAYAPFSHFQVGAALLTEKGNLYAGCNVENSSYGLTICAERSAIVAAVAGEGGDKLKIRAIAVINARKQHCVPCGACRQFIYEFSPDALVLFYSRDGLQEKTIAELLPYGFGFL
ncbi:cytidine deaminase [Lusitaniella coriacea LEGE 07157]|uniref:Cytidine deaminase n=1 Tax=Lusitaniella coriacea LEGE 07157 TaxID=945747 RepID=A0A8J7AMJ0_9CYAN|nr:cytidine deaminase [Lusitaniella coriacea]MBE9114588.1 cytidine deaminase [Lusitaniella coriacea LEGE 07157]